MTARPPTRALCGALLMALPVVTAAEPQSVLEYVQMPLEDLLSMEVSSASRKPQSLARTAAAVHVITQEDIRRSGATSIPEALRMAPGVQVARINSSQWAVSIRGFNGRFTNKLLVLIDGRSVYAPAFSGVYWEAQDTLLEDIDHIEVIRGPGAAVWGANAVNGIINVITKHSADTQGGLISLGAGDHEQGFAGARYGGALTEDTYGRAYVKGFERDNFTRLSDGADAQDDWESVRGGFRIDGEASADSTFTLQGDTYDNDLNTINIGDPSRSDIDSSGWNLLARWEQQRGDQATTRFQVYFDHTERDENFLDQAHDTLDLDFTHRLRLGARHDLQWGLGYRNIRDDMDGTPRLTIIPDDRSDDLFSAFVQDEIGLLPDKLYLTLGSKFEDNDYSGFEVQPTARLLWVPREDHILWASVSRAVRTPSRFEHDGVVSGFLNPAVSLVADDGFDSEELIAYELGYRTQLHPDLSIDIAAFYNDYDDLRNFVPTSSPLNFGIDNVFDGESHGLEVAVDWRPRDWWHLQAYYAYLKVSLHPDPDKPSPISDASIEGSSPQHQASLRSLMDLGRQWQLDLWAQYTDVLSAPGPLAELMGMSVDSYLSLTARLAWKPRPDLELSLVGKQLLDDKRLEFFSEQFTPPTEIERSVFGQLCWEL